MGSDDLFKKRRKARKKKKHEYKQPNVNSFLIVTEGKKTEPNYFDGIKTMIHEKIGGNIDVVQLPVIDIRGEGRATIRLVEIAEQKVKEAKVFYQNVWIVFDKDDFEDFDEAIKLGEAKGYNIAWTNPSFEFWLYLHFYYSDSSLDRREWNNKLNQIFSEKNLGDGKYRKNYTDIFELVNKYNGSDKAVKNAKQLMSKFNKKQHLPSNYNPGTTVHILVEELKKYLEA